MMHDWTLLALMVDWGEGKVSITFRNNKSEEVVLSAERLFYLNIPKREEWGRSISVNEAEGPKLLQDGNSYFSIEMQSGDQIELVARSISLPDYGG